MNTENNGIRQLELRKLAECFGAGELDRAECIARQLFDADNQDEEALHLLAQTVFRQGRGRESVALMEALFELNPMPAAYHNDFGVMLASLDRWAEAEASHRMSLVLDPSGVDARYNLALALYRQKKNNEALDVLNVLSSKAPEFSEQYALRGDILQAENRHAEAVVAYSKAIELGEQSAELLGRLGVALSDAGSQDEAFALLAKSGALDSQDPATNFYLGNLFREHGSLDDAAKYYAKAIEVSPRFAEALNNLGLVLQAQGDKKGAEEAFAKGIRAEPRLSALHNNMGNNQLQLGHMDVALACFRKATELSPDSFDAWNNLGETYYRLQRLDEAEASYRKALALKPDCAAAELNLGILLLLRGDFQEGWKYYEKRWEMPHISQKRPKFSQPEWQGEALNDKTLLIYVEQGMGDNIQFVRYLRVLRDLYPDARIYYWGLKPLMRLFADYAASCGVELLPETIPGGLPPIDFHIALMTIPERLGTTLDTIPASVPYLMPSPELVEKWAKRLAGCRGKKVGLVWTSGETYLFHMFRTMPLARLKPLLDVPGISWVSLQKGAGAAQIASEGLSAKIINLMNEVEDFADTAAIIASLDLVVSVDTSVVHLAGAVGVPVWLLDRFDTDWRWLLGRSDSPWYPTMRIFRQASFGDWDSVIAQVLAALTSGPDLWDTFCANVAMLTREQDRSKQNAERAMRTPMLCDREVFGDGYLKYMIVQTRHGWMLANPNDFYIGRALIDYGEYNELESEFLHQCCFRAGRIIEVGGNMGSHTVGLAKLAAKKGETMEVFEPQPVVFQNLCANLALNGVRNVRAWPLACGDKPGVVTFPEQDYGKQGNFGGVGMSYAEPVKGAVSVPCVRLDDVLGNAPVALIKIDVEGFELSVLSGAENTLKQWRPVLYVENDRVDESQALIEWLWSHEYELYWHIPRLFNPNNYFGNDINQYQNVASFNMLCVPAEISGCVSGLVKITDSSAHPLSK